MLKEGKTSFEDANRFLSDSEVIHDALYFKSGSSRQSIELPGGYQTDIEDEYRAMQRLYDEMPDLVVEPVELVENPEGHLMEYVDGRNLQSAVREDLDDHDVEYVLEQAGSFGRGIRESRIPHGDIRASNFIIMDNSELRAIDPAGVARDQESTRISLDQKAINWDITDVNNHILDRIA